MTGTDQKPRGLHQIALVALFTVGNTLLRFPWATAATGIAVSFLLTVLAALATSALLYLLALRVLRRRISGHRWRQICAAVLGVAVSAVALIGAAKSTADLLRFLGWALLPQGSAILFSALFLAAAVWLSQIPGRGLDLFALIAFCAASVAVAVLFLRAVPQFQSEYGAVTIPRPDAFGASVRPLFSEIVLPMVPLAFYLALAAPRRNGKGSPRPLLFGVAAGCGLMLLCVLQTLLTFGAPYAATLEYPYAKAVRVVSVGQYAFRPEILSYLLDYAATLCRAAVCFGCVKRLFGRFLPRRARIVPPLAGIAVFVFLYLK